MILMVTVALLIYRGYRPPVTVSLWALTGILTLVLVKIHMSDSLPLEF
jgi:hypothetical protein